MYKAICYFCRINEKPLAWLPVGLVFFIGIKSESTELVTSASFIIGIQSVILFSARVFEFVNTDLPKPLNIFNLVVSVISFLSVLGYMLSSV